MKARFRYGQWVKDEGFIYDRFTEEMIIKPEELPEMGYYTVGERIQELCFKELVFSESSTIAGFIV